jgi:hypothetical protein
VSDDSPPDILFRITVFKDGTVETWSSSTITSRDFGEAVIAVGEAFRDNAITMIASEYLREE